MRISTHFYHLRASRLHIHMEIRRRGGPQVSRQRVRIQVLPYRLELWQGFLIPSPVTPAPTLKVAIMVAQLAMGT